jgi:hypothetical protein
MIYTGAEPKHKIKRGQNAVIYAVSYKIKILRMNLKRLEKNFPCRYRDPCQTSCLCPGYAILSMHFSNDYKIYSISFA